MRASSGSTSGASPSLRAEPAGHLELEARASARARAARAARRARARRREAGCTANGQHAGAERVADEISASACPSARAPPRGCARDRPPPRSGVALLPEVAQAVDADDRHAALGEDLADRLVEVAPAAVAGPDHREQRRRARAAGARRAADREAPLRRVAPRRRLRAAERARRRVRASGDRPAVARHETSVAGQSARRARSAKPPPGAGAARRARAERHARRRATAPDRRATAPPIVAAGDCASAA